MPEQTSLPPKVTFALGLLAGVALVSTIGFFTVLPKVWGGNTNEGKVLGTSINTNSQPAANPTPREQPTSVNPALLPPVTSEDHIRGTENAKITLIEYSDFECPFCLRHVPTVEKLLNDYKGKVRLIYRNFPLSFHPQAQKAAEAAECAGEQGKFWEMHDKIFEANTNGNMSVDTWKKTASNLKLNTNKFNDCVDSGKYVGKIQKQQAEGAEAGVEGTPATFVNGKLVSGAVPYEQFKTIIDGLL